MHLVRTQWPPEKTDATNPTAVMIVKERNHACVADFQLILELVASTRRPRPLSRYGDDVLVRAAVPM